MTTFCVYFPVLNCYSSTVVIYSVAQNKISHHTKCNFSTTDRFCYQIFELEKPEKVVAD